MENSALIKVTDTVYHLKVRYPFAMREMNSYLIHGDRGFTIVDTGSIAHESITTWENLLHSGVKIEKIVFTHAHPDHIGLAGWFQKNYGIPTYISTLGYQEMKSTRSGESAKWINDLSLMHGGPEIPVDGRMNEAAAFEFEPDGTFEIGQPVRLGNDSYDSIWTPGHSHDHICFYQPEQQIMILGDLVIDHLSPVIAVWKKDDGNALGDYFQSLDRLKVYPMKYGLPGHGNLISNVNKRIEEILSRHHDRLNQVLHTLNEKEKNCFQLTTETYGKIEEEKFFPQFMSTITRMIYLESVGKVTKRSVNGILYYQKVS